MLLEINKYGGLAPKYKDAALLPENKSQAAVDCRFDRGGIYPLNEDTVVDAANYGAVECLYVYRPIHSTNGTTAGTRYFFTFTDHPVRCVPSPVPDDSWDRVYFTYNGNFRVTDNVIFNSGSGQLPQNSLNPCPPAPSAAPTATITSGAPSTPITGLYIQNPTTTGESDGTHALIFAGGGGTLAAGTYHITSNVIDNATLTVPGNNYTSTVTVSTQTGTGLITASIMDPTYLQTKGYVFTYLNKYGSEGPPSPDSNLVDIYDGNSVTVTGLGLLGLTNTDYQIQFMNLYRINQTASGTDQYQFVAQYNFNLGTWSPGGSAGTTFVDVTYDAGLAEVLPSTDWDPAPSGLIGLISLSNGVMAGFIANGNLIALSVPYYPQGWPVIWQQAIEEPIVGLGAYGSKILILTEGAPYVIDGTNPATATPYKMEGHSCSSKQGIVQFPEFICYPSPQGLYAIGTAINKLLTDALFIQQEWQQKYLYAGTSPLQSPILAWYWEGKYVGFYQGAIRYTGFIYDPKTDNITDLDMYATAGYYDHFDGTLYLVVNGQILSFSTSSTTWRTFSWTSRLYRYLKNCFKCMKVYTAAKNFYPITINVNHPDLGINYNVTATSQEPFRLPQYTSESAQISISADVPVSAVFLANSYEELKV